MYVKDLKKKFLVIKNGGISRWTLSRFLYKNKIEFSENLAIGFYVKTKFILY